MARWGDAVSMSIMNSLLLLIAISCHWTLFVPVHALNRLLYEAYRMSMGVHNTFIKDTLELNYWCQLFDHVRREYISKNLFQVCRLMINLSVKKQEDIFCDISLVAMLDVHAKYTLNYLLQLQVLNQDSGFIWDLDRNVLNVSSHRIIK